MSVMHAASGAVMPDLTAHPHNGCAILARPGWAWLSRWT